MIRSAIAIASAMADSNAGEGRPSQFASFLAARMLAAMSSTRLRPSSTEDSLAYSSFVRLQEAALGLRGGRLAIGGRSPRLEPDERHVSGWS